MLEDIVKKFDIKGDLTKVESIITGNINKTYVATFTENGKEVRVLIQNINTNVFKEPYKLMENIGGITNHIAKKVIAEKGDPERETLNVIKTKNGKSLYVEKRSDDESRYWRAYKYLEGTVCYDKAEDTEMLRNAAIAFGKFQEFLSDYPVEKLEETLPDFHNTPLRYLRFIQDLKTDAVGRSYTIAEEISFVKERVEKVFWLKNLISVGEIPLRVTHNDTKTNNVMMDKKTGKGICVIDLDTVQPDSVLVDIGDGIRAGASNALEDETDLSKVFLRLELFEAFLDGFLRKTAKSLTEVEVRNISRSVHLLALELGIRFLDDYINGDTYFNIKYENHNLDRARNQFKLVQDIESKLDVMDKIVEKIYKKYS